jgi:hypothetical protein
MTPTVRLSLNYCAVSRQPWTWSLSQRGFAPWPDFNYRGELVEPPSVAARMTPP